MAKILGEDRDLAMLCRAIREKGGALCFRAQILRLLTAIGRLRMRLQREAFALAEKLPEKC